jgi:ABC-type nitrate/sulfonate/bicarbonate transport system substrate-binding protein
MLDKRDSSRSTPVRRLRTAVAVLGCASILAACGGAEGAGTEVDVPQVSFVTAKGALEWWPVQFGQEQGIFDDAGLDMTFVQAKSGPEITSIVTSGSADLGMGVLEAAVTPISQGAAMSILDIPGITPSSSVIVSPEVELKHADSGYPESATDLEGLTIGVTALGSPMERYLATALDDAGMTLQDVTLVAVGAPPTAIPAFTEGKVDALVAYDPVHQLLGKDAYQTVVTAEDLAEHASGPAGDVFFFAADGFADTREAGTFCGAVRETYQAIKDPANEDAAIESLSAWTGLAPDQGAAVLANLQERLEDTALDQATWERARAFLSTDPPAYEEAVTEGCG